MLFGGLNSCRSFLMKPLGNRVLIKKPTKKVSGETLSAGGITLLEGSSVSTDGDDKNVGIIVAISKDLYRSKAGVKIGDACTLDIEVGSRVIFSPFDATPVKFEDEDMLIVDYEDLLAVR